MGGEGGSGSLVGVSTAGGESVVGGVGLPVALVDESVAFAVGRGCVERDFGVAGGELAGVAGVACCSRAGSELEVVVGASALAARVSLAISRSNSESTRSSSPRGSAQRLPTGFSRGVRAATAASALPKVFEQQWNSMRSSTFIRRCKSHPRTSRFGRSSFARPSIPARSCGTMVFPFPLTGVVGVR
mgnify:CR=1 FL=1